MTDPTTEQTKNNEECSKPKKTRCRVCSKNISVLKMNCKYCRVDFCVRHYLPEVHSCPEMCNDVPCMVLPKAIQPKKVEKI